jgi:hypothetical protein
MVVKQRMQELSEQLKNAEQNKNKILIEQLSQEYVTLSGQVKNY